MAVLQFTQNYKRYLTWLVALVFIPVLLLKVSAPFQLYDFIASVPGEMFVKPSDILGFHAFLTDFIWNLNANSLHLRPSSAVIYNIEYTFLGLPWLQFSFKMAVIVAVPFLTARWVFMLTENNFAALIAGAIVVVHPAPSTMHLASSESYSAFLTMALLILAVHRPLMSLREKPDRLNFRRRDIVCDPLFLIGTIVLLGLKENMFATAGALGVYYYVLNKRFSYPALLLSCMGVLFIAIALTIFRLYQLRFAHPDPLHAQTFLEFLNDFRERFQDCVRFLSPAEPQELITIFTAGTIAALTMWGIAKIAVARHRDRAALLSSAALIAFIIVLATLVLSSVPAAYPPHETPRYVVPAVPAMGALIGFALAVLPRLASTLLIILVGLVVLISPAKMFEREIVWAKYNQTFSAVLRRAIDLNEDGYVLYVEKSDEVMFTVTNFFSDFGRRIFRHPYPDIKPVEDLKLSERKFAVVADCEPYVFRRDVAIPADFVLSDISVASNDVVSSSGADRLLRLMQVIPHALGISSTPFYEGGTVDIATAGRPPFHIYSFCRKSDLDCVPIKTRTLHDACEDLAQSNGGREENTSGATTMSFTTDKPIKIDYSLEALRGNGPFLVQLEGMSAQRGGALRLLMDDWQGWNNTSKLTLSPQWLNNPIFMPASKTAHVTLYSLEDRADYTVTCPFKLMAYPVTLIEWQRQWGAFQP